MGFMITTTPSPARRKRRAARPHTAGMTLVEVLIAATLGSILMFAVISTFIFLGRSGANLANYAEMEMQGRNALEIFAEDARQASELTWNSADSVDLTVSGSRISYTYDSAAEKFTRQTPTSTRVLLTGVTKFEFLAYTIAGATVATSDLSTSAKRESASKVTKQIQISLSAKRSTQTVATATNTVLSARFILRNKRVTS